MVEFKSIMGLAADIFFSAQVNRVDTSSKMILVLVLLKFQWEYKEMWELVNFDDAEEWKATESLRNVPKKIITMDPKKQILKNFQVNGTWTKWKVFYVF